MQSRTYFDLGSFQVNNWGSIGGLKKDVIWFNLETAINEPKTRKVNMVIRIRHKGTSADIKRD